MQQSGASRAFLNILQHRRVVRVYHTHAAAALLQLHTTTTNKRQVVTHIIHLYTHIRRRFSQIIVFNCCPFAHFLQCRTRRILLLLGRGAGGGGVLVDFFSLETLLFTFS